MQNEEHFYKELNNIPEVPENLYPKISKKIRQYKFVFRSIWLIAACLVFVIVGIQYFQFKSAKNNELMLEVAHELQSISDYFNEQDTENNYTLSTINNGEVINEFSIIINYFSGNNIQQDIDIYTIIDKEFL